MPIVVLDPGHGGDNAGTKMAIAPHTKEKTLALQTAHKVRDLLEQWGYTVRLTRTKDVFVPLEKRVELARQFKGSLFVSLHYNHAPNKEAHGIEIFYFEKSKFAKSSKRLGQDILKNIIAKTKAASRGVHAADFHVLRENSMPAVLVEGGFFSNVQEAKKLSNPKYLNTLSLAIAKGIDDFIQNELVR
jgi:N-acetylmuramoyl-L-alanine amidase